MNPVITPSVVELSGGSHSPASITILRGSVELMIADIVRLEGERNYTRFVLRQGRSILTSRNLSYYAKLLPTTFMRVHKGCLVNRYYVRAFEWRQVVLTDGTELPIARRKRRKVKNDTY